MDALHFRNILVSLMNIDLDQLVEAGVITEGNIDNGGSSWTRFNDQPLIFVAKLDDTRLEALWKLVEARQKPATADDADAVRALTAASHALRSYQYGNGSTELAEATADLCVAALASLKGGA